MAYPVKAPKPTRPHRQGVAYWLEQGGEVLLVRRPARGLLGGMIALPEDEPAPLSWQDAGAVDHVFTHFSLNMRLLCAELEHRPEGLSDAHWWPVERIGDAGLPTLFAKLAARGLAWREKEIAAVPVRQGVLI